MVYDYHFRFPLASHHHVFAWNVLGMDKASATSTHSGVTQCIIHFSCHKNKTIQMRCSAILITSSPAMELPPLSRNSD
jgi:hypothetical protein